MRRGVHIAISLMAIILLVRPFDCFATGASQKAADCCLKGKCAPTAKSDECCKNTVPDGNQLVTPKAADHSFPLAVSTVARVPTLILPLIFGRLIAPVMHPPPRIDATADSLPLLI